MRKIAIITGTRADYGRLRPVIDNIEKSEELQPALIVTGMHLEEKYGYTVNEIEKDKHIIAARVNVDLNLSTNFGMVKSLGRTIIGVTEAVEKIKPDMILVLGDRGEALSGAIVGAHLNIPVAHLHGGEVTGSIDESIRHATTKFSHIHFAATEKSRQRIIKLGEKPEFVYNVGSPGLDSILNRKYNDKEYICNKLGIKSNKKVILMIQHSVTSEASLAGEQVLQTLKAIARINEQIVIIYPNSDAGSTEILENIKKYEMDKNVKSFKNIEFDDYLDLLSCTDVIVGNSSSGIMEAPSFKVPSVNIGTRQEGRERSTNIIDVNYDENEIYNAAIKSLYDDQYKSYVKNCINPYGDGKAGERVAEILGNIQINNDLLQKKITY